MTATVDNSEMGIDKMTPFVPLGAVLAADRERAGQRLFAS
ncbi:urease accessory protein UreF [Haloarcula japonica DSM 6131]|uniref:Urease accessory protein UreF n=1 Tax=Haloarcula japonica (strain ATCC 49778 / DSM 6131 / JCM 7785 / NBRC 101032 / NCIMB 13157 / TR-1) TaxID=1227453 RepID=M0L5F6_HALJT|nr:urease accessory protein UreF [Haloarcula japonica DSM 6131]